MKHAVLIDGGFFRVKFSSAHGKRYPSANDVVDFATKCRSKTNADGGELLRIYFYDSPPLELNEKLPISGGYYNFSQTPEYSANKKLHSELKRKDFFAVREGKLVFRGWQLKANRVIPSSGALSDRDYRPDIQQKGVDIKIGIDIAWLSFQRIVDRILLVTGDSDLIPAMKLARRNGIQVFLFTLGHGTSDELKDHTDRLIDSDIRSLLT